MKIRLKTDYGPWKAGDVIECDKEKADDLKKKKRACSYRRRKGEYETKVMNAK